MIHGKSLAFVQRPSNVLQLHPPFSLSLREVPETPELKNFLSWRSKRSYFTASDMRNLSPASGPLTAGKEKNPSPSPRVCIIFSWSQQTRDTHGQLTALAGFGEALLRRSYEAELG
ncbi:hypothetical protein SRHO_G00093260 [Serrasalmus rhombeus]